jgi:DNA-binding LytR/AlgR family response regulator
MPGEMGGLELAHRMREERPDVAVILTTGYSASAAEAAAEGLRLLAKPYTLEALAAELEIANGQSRTVART